MTIPDIEIPENLKPTDGRFGAGPSKVSPRAADAVAAAGSSLMGTSHRQAPVRNLVKSVQAGVSELFNAPEAYHVVLGIGGANALCATPAVRLVRENAQHLSFGEFGAKYAQATNSAPCFDDSGRLQADPGTRPVPRAESA